MNFCFKKRDLSTIKLAHLDFSLMTLFVIVTSFESILYVCSLQLQQKVCMFYDGNIFWQHILKPLVLLSDFLQIVILIMFLNDVLVASLVNLLFDSLMWLFTLSF